MIVSTNEIVKKTPRKHTVFKGSFIILQMVHLHVKTRQFLGYNTLKNVLKSIKWALVLIL